MATAPNRLVVLEVPDVATEDDIKMTIAVWNDAHPARRIVYRIVYSTPIGMPFRQPLTAAPHDADGPE